SSDLIDDVLLDGRIVHPNADADLAVHAMVVDQVAAPAADTVIVAVDEIVDRIDVGAAAEKKAESSDADLSVDDVAGNLRPPGDDNAIATVVEHTIAASERQIGIP